jgi:serine/threonine protein kinase
MSSRSDLGQLSPSEWDELQELADRFEAACRSSAAVDLDRFLPTPGSALRPLALRELIAIQLDARWRRGERPRVADYVVRFPELATGHGQVAALLYEEVRLRLQQGERPDLAEYARAYPDHVRALEQMLADRPLASPGEESQLGETISTTLQQPNLHPPELGTTLDYQPRGASAFGAVEERIGDFELLRVLGEGSFGKVYLARQVSLDRLVALKLTSDTSSEARTLASLEHDHIVQVFSEKIDGQRNQRLLCMQFVAGPTLERIIAELKRQPRSDWSGQLLLDLIDRFSQHAATFHPAALRDREMLARADFIQAVCWVGARLAEALDYAHARGVLHRDVKPANILFSQYGRPMLGDFNVSLNTRKVSAARGGLGGTIAYMAPEHLDACNPDGETLREFVAERSDLYSLGVTLFELLTGQRPFQDKLLPGGRTAEALRVLTEQRRRKAPSARVLNTEVPPVLDGVLRRCLAPEPGDRYASAAELARALEGCRELRRIERELPPGSLATRIAVARPFLAFMIVALVPQLISSGVNIAYNWLEIVSRFRTEELRTAFNQVALTYNVLLYPFCTFLLFRQVWAGYRLWKRLYPDGDQTPELLDAKSVASARRKLLAWPAWTVSLSAVGWLPGGLLLPLGIDLLAGPLAMEVYVHFLISFTLSGLIALTYTYFGVQFVVFRSLYPRFWVDPQHVRMDIARELRQRGPRQGLFQLLAGVIPLAGAILMVAVGPEVTGYLAFRVLASLLILLGMAGFGLAVAANKFLADTLGVLTGTERGR